MPVARQRHSKARRDRARKMLVMKTKNLGSCPNCKAKIISHVACPKCGFYKGKEVVDMMKRINKKAKKK